jgi:hypothetical protein
MHTDYTRLRPATREQIRAAYRGQFQDEWLIAFWRAWRAPGHGSRLLDLLSPYPAIRGGARNFFAQTTSVRIGTVAAAFKTILQLLGGTNVITVVQWAEIGFFGTSNTAEPANVEILRQTSAGTGGSPRNPLKTKDTSTSLLVTGQEGPASGAWTTEPTAGDILKACPIHPQSGFVYPLPLPDGEVEMPSAGRLGLRVNIAAAVDVRVGWGGEE